MANGYKKIAGGARPGRLAVTTLSLWQGPDHLLQIERDGYAENYRRFHFADIEIFTVRLDNRRRNIAFIFGGLVAIMVAFAVIAFADNSAVGGTMCLTVAGVLLIPFIYNLVRGPSCVVHVTTAVQREELQSVRRLKGALKLLQAIRDNAAQTQGVLAPDMVRVKFELENAPVGFTPPPQPTVSESAPIPFSMESAPSAAQTTETAPAAIGGVGPEPPKGGTTYGVGTEPASAPTPRAAEPPPPSQ